MVTEPTTPDRRDTEGSIGIGAMIVFIALILVAAVASTIIIKTAEELQQNAENTSSDTRQQISGKVSVSDVYITTTHEALGGATGTHTDVSTMTVIARVSSGSLNVQEGDITWYITCKLTFVGGASVGSTFAVVETAVADSLELDGTDIADGAELTAGTTFKFVITLTSSDTDGDNFIDPDDFGSPTVLGDTPGCNAEAGADSTLELRVVVDGGGETLANLKIPSLTLGKSVM
jgi:archaellin